MSTGPSIEVHMGELAQIVEYVFRTMVNLEVSESNRPWAFGPNQLTATIHLAGSWRGALALECAREQACAFAARFLSIPQPDLVDDLVRDVIGELCNMIGGNLKCVLAGGLNLSMPSVVDGADHNLRVCRARTKERLVLDCELGAFSIVVLGEERLAARMH
jgi:CheY-specific phosphatase CheX